MSVNLEVFRLARFLTDLNAVNRLLFGTNTVYFTFVMFWLVCNGLDMMKGLRTGKICSLYQIYGGSVCFIYFTIKLLG